ncbi:zinc-binding alcohol dehydrogenase family protein [Pseudomonas monteilii]|uniref:Zinc-type alcohol dehydrogenase-like protein n=1 Tax=Pseudomonas monteilii TaxID=76759 RepID=A0AAP7KDX5_9PSED|nr:MULTISPECIES: zinc-binding alcohol dehydrogenase family protein [Pseudomonas]AYN15884.1 zinc-binding alcohol dehydrogenase family protein [Pseudomonas monteilii]AYO00455.1 zinc-binding alcohol dehydrogenase family protein [Pseudomonas sp. LTGT-11-2Z]MBA1314910.1 zinc-binding alcohol dehydrogenase family protein [Pseudomonas monteilii]MBA6091130.1 zinc-binding alcohol dehydrogenase family protein [Pseudomonas monteilii]MBA6103267.1 zinc-binding alcohol dehydrogenase family protein [Pseudomon
MKAVVYTQPGLPIHAPQSLYDAELPTPKPGARDLLVEVRAIAVNPVDTKIRASRGGDQPQVLGWDAVGVVREVGPEVTLFRPGDEVFYAGAIDRPGSYSELHVVDERIVGHKPRSLDNASAAALPLTSITAWELLFDRLGVEENGGEGQRLLVVGAGGGVGSILVQLASKLTRLTVIGTASRPETQAWVKALGAHHVIDHTESLPLQLEALKLGPVDYVISLTHTDTYLPQLVEVLRPQGKLALIDDPAQLDVMPLKRKSLSLHWELMFTRSLYKTEDMIKQHQLLDRVAQLVDSGVLKTTLGEHYGTINAEHLKRAHAMIESGKARGKIVLEGF